MTLTVLSGSSNRPLAAQIAQILGVTPCPRTLHRFPDGELHVELEDSVRGQDVYVVQSTSRPVDEHLMELCFLADACRRTGVGRLTAVIPYFGYARQDHRRSSREAVGAAVIANLIEAAGFARVIALDLHAPALEAAFRIPLDHLSATHVLADAIRSTADSVIVAPDLGAARLAHRYQSHLNLPVIVLHKARISGSEVSLRRPVADLGGRTPILIDDMIATGGTIEAAARGLLAAGCKPDLSVAATHALFVGPATARLQGLPIRQWLGTNSVDVGTDLPAHFQVVSVAPLLADAISRLHHDQPLDTLLART